MPTGCIGGASLVGLSKIGTALCGLPGSFTKISGFIPPAPFVSQNTVPQLSVAQAN